MAERRPVPSCHLAALASDLDNVSRHTSYHRWPNDHDLTPMREAS